MKKIILCLILSWMSLVVLGQQNFEGIIEYKMYQKNKQIDTQFIITYYKSDLVKIVIKGKRAFYEYAIINLKDGLRYNIDDDLKVIMIDSLFDNSFMNLKKDTLFKKESFDTRLKYSYFLEKFSSNIYNRDSTFINESKIRLKVAKKLFFKIPQKYFLNTLLLSNGTNVILEIESETNALINMITVNIKAQRIVKTYVNDSEFILPDNYKKLSSKEYLKLISSISNTKRDSLKKKQ